MRPKRLGSILLLLRMGGGTCLAISQSPAPVPPPNPIINIKPGFSLASWGRGTNAPRSPRQWEVVQDSGAGLTTSALHVIVPRLTSWDMLQSPEFRSSPFVNFGANTVFWAKGGTGTRELMVEWDEKDGSRWIADVPLTTRWKRYVLAPGDFHPWPISPERAETEIQLSQVSRFRVGVDAGGELKKAVRREYWISSVWADAAVMTDARTGLVSIDYPEGPVFRVLSATCVSAGVYYTNDPSMGDRAVTVHLRNVPLRQALNIICQAASPPLTYEVIDGVYQFSATVPPKKGP